VGDEDSLHRDFVFTFLPSKNINHENSGPKLRRFLELCRDLGAVKIGDARKGNQYVQGSLEKMIENVEDRAVVQAVFDDADKAARALKALKEADLGLSLVVSALFGDTAKCCAQTGVQMHTVNQSLGRWGRTERLPEGKTLELNTMCGHGMVAVGLIEEAVDRVKQGKWSAEKAAEELFQTCVCGVFNTTRAAGLIRVLAEDGRPG
jgi:hypothetical protein